MDRAIAKAQARMALVLRNEDALHAYQMREMALSDYTGGINHARREGMAIGEQRGEEKTYHAIVRNAAGKGIPAESISELTGLPAEKVRDILKMQ